jgi:hypothetical protein
MCMTAPTKVDNAVKSCTGTTLVDNCLAYSSDAKCAICKDTFTFHTTDTKCFANITTSGTAVDADCVRPKSTAVTTASPTAANTVCEACKNDKKPDNGTATNTALCSTTLTGAALVANCFAHTADSKCLYCKDTFVRTPLATAVHTCTAATGDSVGCIDTDCGMCASMYGYY